MKLILAIINNSDVKEVTASLMKGGFYVTKIGSSGGLLKGGLTTLISAVHEDNVSSALECIRETTHVRKYNANELFVVNNKELPKTMSEEIVVGGASVFVLNIEETHKF